MLFIFGQASGWLRFCGIQKICVRVSISEIQHVTLESD